MDHEVLIVGAGPTGLVLAIWLALQGIKPRIIDKTAGPGTTSRAVAVQARTLELYEQAGLTNGVLAGGHQVPSANFWVRGRKQATIPFKDIGAGLTRYFFVETFAQDAHERLLVAKLETLGVAVERQTELLSFTQAADGVTARLRDASGSERDVTARYIAGCDGARSLVRKTIGADFPGGTYRQLFYVADVDGVGEAFDGALHIDLDDADFLAVFPLKGDGRARLIGTIRDERADQAETLRFEDVSDSAIQNLKLSVTKVNWFSTYHVHHRVAGHFRKDNAFILGDAAHIHSPAGGQGMNTGIGDAINLAWKLAAVLKGNADASLLDSFEAERLVFARKLVATTDRIFSFATAEGHMADLLRTRVAPFVLPKLMGIEAVREFFFSTVSQITLNYRDMPLSEGVAGKVHGGDRLPWATVDSADNYASLKQIGWQAHVYGVAQSDVAAWCQSNNVPLHVFAWHDGFGAAGLARDALYLLRPDSYIALADAIPSADALQRYVETHGIQPA